MNFYAWHVSPHWSNLCVGCLSLLCSILLSVSLVKNRKLCVWPKSVETEPIVAYRWWRYDHLTGLLTSTYMERFQWKPFESVAGHVRSGVGIHAFKSRLELWKQCSCLWRTYARGSHHVIGEVYLWGEVAEHESGYRAQFAYPKELWVSRHPDPITVMNLEANYGVPVRQILDGQLVGILISAIREN
jgi:hypothetical protein